MCDSLEVKMAKALFDFEERYNINKNQDDEDNFEEFDVEFKVISNKNKEVYTEGYVTIHDENAEDTDWYYWNGSGYDSRRVIWHDGVQISGATWKQENEITQFESDVIDDIEWITDAILQSNENDNDTFIRENITLVINGG